MAERSPLELFNGCMKKKAYENRRVAQNMVKIYKKPMRAYKCDRCAAWHLTTRFKKK